MKKVIVSLASLVISSALCGTAQAQAHRNAYGGGSTYHSGNSTSADQCLRWQRNTHRGTGNHATNAYGTSTSHAHGGGTSDTNAYGGTTSAKQLWGSADTLRRYGIRIPDGFCISSARYLLWVPSTCYRGLLRNNMLQLQLWLDCGCRRCRRCSRRGRWDRRGLFQGQL